MSYDLNVEFVGERKQDVDALVNGNLRTVKIPDVYARIQLITAIAAWNPNVKDYAVSGDRRRSGGYKKLVHATDPKITPFATQLIAPALTQLDNFGLRKPTAPDLQTLPPGSWFLQFTFTLLKPWISKDDDLFYVTESVNPVRKDKVFKVPMMSASSWKGVLRWTAMHTRLVQRPAEQSPKAFAVERFVQTLLFGDEQGEQLDRNKGFAAYVDRLNPDARTEYEDLLRTYYKVDKDKPLPQHRGRLMFYPTFFDLIDVEVINPHSRETKAGTHPIYLESVPAGAKGTFSLLYVPFDLTGRSQDSISDEAGKHLRYLTPIVKEMFLIYGFSAKRSSGFGVAEDTVSDGRIQTNIPAAAQQANPPQQPVMPEALRTFMEQFPDEDFSLKPNAWRKRHKATNTQREQYRDAKAAHAQFEKAKEAYEAALRAWEAQAAEPVQSFVGDSFESFEELTAKAAHLIPPAD